MALSWSFRRKLLYSTSIFLVSALCVGLIWYKFFTVVPTCFDHAQNGQETGVDCGGTCSLLCANEVHNPIVLWARGMPNGPSTYTGAAYIQNNNPEVGAHNVHYAFQFFDADNRLVVEKDGVTDIPPVQTVPVIEPTIETGTRTVARALFSLSDTPVWERVPHGSVPTIKITNQVLRPDATRLDATIVNDSLKDYSQVTVVAVLFDSGNVARAASRSAIPLLSAKSTFNVVFTWPEGVAGIARAEISVLPSF